MTAETYLAAVAANLGAPGAPVSTLPGRPWPDRLRSLVLDGLMSIMCAISNLALINETLCRVMDLEGNGERVPFRLRCMSWLALLLWRIENECGCLWSVLRDGSDEHFESLLNGELPLHLFTQEDHAFLAGFDPASIYVSCSARLGHEEDAPFCHWDGSLAELSGGNACPCCGNDKHLTPDFYWPGETRTESNAAKVEHADALFSWPFPAYPALPAPRN